MNIKYMSYFFTLKGNIMKKLLLLLISSASFTGLQAWEAAKPTTPAPAPNIPVIGAQRGPAPLGNLTESIKQAATGDLTKSMDQVKPQIPDLTLNLNLDIVKQDLNQNCYQNVNNTIYEGAGTNQIVNGNCNQTGGQQSSKGRTSGLGKAGDIAVVDFSKLTLIRNFGTVSQLVSQIFAVPQISTDWENGVYFSFNPTNPQISDVWQTRGVSSSALQGRSVQVVIRTRALTQALAQQENRASEWIAGKNQVLVEVWARTQPSLTGSPALTEILSYILGAEDVGAKGLLFSADQLGNAAVSLKTTDATQGPVNLISRFNVTQETN